MKHLMIFSIGPVQEFIATARRSRDLWYGSWMLSELSKAAAKKIRELDPPSELVFPYPSDPRLLDPASDFNVPNKIVAVIDGGLKNFGEIILKAVKARLNELWSDARSHVKGEGRIDDALAQKQIDDLLEFYWASVPYDENKDSYSKVRDAAEFLLAARKTTRNFKQATGSSVPKSSLDGARESVVPKKEYPERKDTADVKKKKIENLYKYYHARQGEQLSGVDILKRLGDPAEKAPKFKSTSDMAAIPFIELVDKRSGTGKGSELLDKIQKLLPSDSDTLDGAHEGLVFERRFEDGFPSQHLPEDTQKKFAGLLKEYAGDAQPNPYYALLAADGDNMGIVIDAQTDPKIHRDLSKALSDFALAVPEKVADCKGVLIYSGGDDVLAYLPLHTALECAKRLEKAFRDHLQKYKAKNKNGREISPTLSIGIAVTHHLEPLADALELARTAEKEAKKVDGKNGLAIIASKRSGADRLISGKWHIFDRRLNQLIGFVQADEISAGIAYELQELHRILAKTGIPAQGLADEALRIVGRKKKSGGEAKVSDNIKKAFRQWLATEGIPVEELAKEMIIAGMFTSESQPAEEAKEAAL